MARVLPKKTLRLPLRSVAETQYFAEICASACFENDAFLLSGSLGSGKTAFARFFIRAISDDPPDVASPTFPIVLEYETQKGLLRHYDLYRLKDYEEIFHIGLEDAMQQGIILAEWPEIAASLFPEESVRIVFSHLSEGARRADVTGPEHVTAPLRIYAETMKA
ncbi:MAG: tRNA (adenosine(37)-N6)-threonylcarbamoyltransferase complex ATPase subunit type 1 TsaE [Rickettsiales bacterium]